MGKATDIERVYLRLDEIEQDYNWSSDELQRLDKAMTQLNELTLDIRNDQENDPVEDKNERR